MSRIAKRQLTIPPITDQGYKAMQEAACSDEASCKGLACRQCIYYKDNFKHFINYFALWDAPGTITVKEIIKEEE
jgi:hypothetical protein